MSLESTLDHIAIAVPSLEEAEARWRDLLGGRYVKGGDGGRLAWRQLRYVGGGRLELLTTSPTADEPTVVTRFLERFGARIHHVTLTVPDLLDALDALRGGGLDVVDIDLDDERWQEAFLRPSQIGGLVVQIAHSATGASGAGEGASAGEAPSSDGARLVGAALSHPDLDRAARLWETLGATVERERDRLRLRWTDSPLELTISPGRGGPIGLWMRGTAPLPHDEELGPAVFVREPPTESA